MDETKTDQEKLQKRQADLQNWFHEILPSIDSNSGASAKEIAINPLSGDASFRRYFTVSLLEKIYVLVDAPPKQEDCRAFVQVAKSFHAEGINVPKIYAADYEHGFMCISFLGDTLLWEKLQLLKSENRFGDANLIYKQAFEILLKIQGINANSGMILPPYDGGLLESEMDLFREWFCSGIMGLSLSKTDNVLLDHYFSRLLDNALSQQQVCVHRDYHSRNLTYQADGNFGLLDFQDAMVGPITYDLVSLIKDCYVSWPRPLIREWALQYANMAQTAGIINSFNDDEFLFHFDMMGVQRHLKAIGIFSRLYLRDKKLGYIADIPRTLAYIKEVLSEYPDMNDFSKWLEKNIYSTLETRLSNILDRNPAF